MACQHYPLIRVEMQVKSLEAPIERSDPNSVINRATGWFASMVPKGMFRVGLHPSIVRAQTRRILRSHTWRGRQSQNDRSLLVLSLYHSHPG